MIYLDHAASTPIVPSALDVLKISLEKDFANPSSAHKLGRSLCERIDQSRSVFLKKFNCAELYDFFFTSSATESNNTIINNFELAAGDAILLTSADHPSLVVAAKYWGEKGVEILEMPIDQAGRIKIDELMDMVDRYQNIKALLLTHVNNQTGNIQNIEIIAERVRQKSNSIHIHVDAVQSCGKLAMDLSKGHISSMSVSGHKIGGPKGVAGLFIRKDLPYTPLLKGGDHENKRRASTHPTSLIFAFAAALEMRLERQEQNYQHVKKLHHMAKEALTANGVMFPFEDVCPYILTFIIPQCSTDIIMRHMEAVDIFISTTSACSSKMRKSNTVFKALHIPDKFHQNVLRVSFAPETTEGEVEKFISTLKSVLNDLSKVL